VFPSATRNLQLIKTIERAKSARRAAKMRGGRNNLIVPKECKWDFAKCVVHLKICLGTFRFTAADYSIALLASVPLLACSLEPVAPLLRSLPLHPVTLSIREEPLRILHGPHRGLAKQGLALLCEF